MGSHFLDPTFGPKDGSAPLHPGATHYFTEAGILKAPAQKAALPARPAARKS
jgi:hypothetical protein